jgi:hypothetical protein
MSVNSIEKATKEDVEFFSNDAPKPTMKAFVAKKDGKPIALFGLARELDGRWYAFFDITDEARPYKVTIAKTARKIMDEARKMGLRFVYAVPDEEEPMARKWLERLGFKTDKRSGVLMRWENG